MYQNTILSQAIRLSAAVAVTGVCATSTQAAETGFRDAIQQGNVTAEIKNVMAQASRTDAISAAGPLNNSNVGGSSLTLGYETAAYHGLTFGVGFQAGIDWNLHKDETSGFSGEDDSRLSISATNLHQAFVDYAFDPSATQTSIRLGRQSIISPLVMSSGLFPMSDAFDALVITNNDLPSTNLRLMVLKNWIKRYGDDATLSPVHVDDRFSDSVYSLYLNNKSISGLDIEVQWLSNDSDDFIGDPPTAVAPIGPYDTSFMAVTYAIPDSTVTLGAKRMTASFDDASSTDLWGAKANMRAGELDLGIAYTSTDEANSLPGTLGHVPLFRAYTDTVTDAEFIAGVDTLSASLGYGFGIPGLQAKVVYASWSQSDEGITHAGIDLDGASEVALDVKYVSQDIKGLFTRVQLSQVDYDLASGDSDMTYLRLTMNYKF